MGSQIITQCKRTEKAVLIGLLVGLPTACLRPSGVELPVDALATLLILEDQERGYIGFAGAAGKAPVRIGGSIRAATVLVLPCPLCAYCLSPGELKLGSNEVEGDIKVPLPDGIPGPSLLGLPTLEADRLTRLSLLNTSPNKALEFIGQYPILEPSSAYLATDGSRLVGVERPLLLPLVVNPTPNAEIRPAIPFQPAGVLVGGLAPLAPGSGGVDVASFVVLLRDSPLARADLFEFSLRTPLDGIVETTRVPSRLDFPVGAPPELLFSDASGTHLLALGSDPATRQTRYAVFEGGGWSSSALLNRVFERNRFTATWDRGRWIVASQRDASSAVLTATSAASGEHLGCVAPAGPGSYWGSAPGRGVFLDEAGSSVPLASIGVADHMAGDEDGVVVASGQLVSFYQRQSCARPHVWRSEVPVVGVGLTSTLIYVVVDAGGSGEILFFSRPPRPRPETPDEASRAGFAVWNESCSACEQ